MLTPALLALSLIAQSPPPRPRPALTPTAPALAPRYEPKAGEGTYLNVQPGRSLGPRTFFLITAPSKAAWDRYLALNREGAGRSKYEEMAAAGGLFSEFANTRVRVVTPHTEIRTPFGADVYYPVEVQFLEGPWVNLYGFISNLFLTPAPNADPAFTAAVARARAADQLAQAAALRKAQGADRPRAVAATPARETGFTPVAESSEAARREQAEREAQAERQAGKDAQAQLLRMQLLSPPNWNLYPTREDAVNQRLQNNTGVRFDANGVIIP